MQAKVDALVASIDGTNVTLADICFKPFGDICATQSVLQYWHMDPAAYAGRGGHTPEYCFQHTTECRSAFEAPIDPQLVLGGFPRDPAAQHNYRYCMTDMLHCVGCCCVTSHTRGGGGVQ